MCCPDSTMQIFYRDPSLQSFRHESAQHIFRLESTLQTFRHDPTLHTFGHNSTLQTFPNDASLQNVRHDSTLKHLATTLVLLKTPAVCVSVSVKTITVCVNVSVKTVPVCVNMYPRWITCPWVWRRKKIYEFQNRENVIILIVNYYFQPLSYVIWCCGTKSECTFDIFLCIYSDFLWFCGRQRIVNNIQDLEGW
jgi:hypothetical protein